MTRTAILTLLLACLQAGPALAQDGAVPFRKVALEDAGIEMPVPADWVRIPSSDESGAEALFVSVQDRAELDVFSVPFECWFDEEHLKEHAAQMHDFVSPSAEWEGTRFSIVKVGGVKALSLRALWQRMDEPADVFGLAVPTRGRTAVILLVMARQEGQRLGDIASLIESRTILLAPPAGGPPGETGPYNDGRGFSVTPPAGWRRVRPEEIEVLAGRAAEDATDVVAFVRPGILRQSPNFIVATSPSSLPVSEEMLEEFVARYRMLVGERQTAFTIDSSSLATVAGRKAFLVEGRTEAVGQTVRQMQYFVPSGDHHLVITISVPASLEKRLGDDVRAIIESIDLDGEPEPGPEPEPAGTVDRERVVSYLAGGAAVAAALALVVLWMRRRRG